jgi:hypothetical protein
MVKKQPQELSASVSARTHNADFHFLRISGNEYLFNLMNNYARTVALYRSAATATAASRKAETSAAVSVLSAARKTIE